MPPHARERQGPARSWPKAASPSTSAGATPSAPADDLIRKTHRLDLEGQASLSLERDLFAGLREDAEAVAIKVFADNLRDLLLAAPAGKRVVMGLDPGIRTGVQGGGGRATPARCWRPTPSTRTSRATTGRARCTRWARLVRRSTAST